MIKHICNPDVGGPLEININDHVIRFVLNILSLLALLQKLGTCFAQAKVLKFHLDFGLQAMILILLLGFSDEFDVEVLVFMLLKLLDVACWRVATVLIPRLVLRNDGYWV